MSAITSGVLFRLSKIIYLLPKGNPTRASALRRLHDARSKAPMLVRLWAAVRFWVWMCSVDAHLMRQVAAEMDYPTKPGSVLDPGPEPPTRLGDGR